MGNDGNGKQERRWRNMTVDANLRDEWLADLNRMRAGVCNGAGPRWLDRCLPCRLRRMRTFNQPIFLMHQ